MASQTLTHSHQSTATLAGAWKLAGGRAMTLQPREPGVLRVARGGLWATVEGPHPGPLNDQGDRFLQAGEQLQLRRGQRVVIEAWTRLGPAYFSWDALAQPVARRVRVADLAQPVEDLRLAGVLGVRAAGRLVAALVGLGWSSLGRDGRPSLAECAFKAHSSA
jgi:Protein of unknown function (DUF2917)